MNIKKLFVTKYDGTKQLFNREKIIKTCIRLGASREISEEIAKKIEMNIYNEIETKKVLKMIFRQVSKYKPVIKHIISLRASLSLLKSRPDFEQYIQILLSEYGYEVTPNQIVKGKCVEHEVDAIVGKNGETYIVEVKHHRNFHARTGLDETRIARAILEDVNEGFELGLNDLKIDKAMIVCNTKYSEHAKRYAECRGIPQIGWSSPPYGGLQTLIEEKKLYPITYLKGLKTADSEKLTAVGIILLRQLTEMRLEELVKTTGISKKLLELTIEKAKTILAGDSIPE